MSSNFKSVYLNNQYGHNNKKQIGSVLTNYSVKSKQLGRSELMVRNK